MLPFITFAMDQIGYFETKIKRKNKKRITKSLSLSLSQRFSGFVVSDLASALQRVYWKSASEPMNELATPAGHSPLNSLLF